MAVKKLFIYFHYPEKRFQLTNRNQLKDFLHRMAKKEGRRVETINYVFCNDEYLLNVNREYLDHDYYTDIISFELSEKGAPILADIFISIDRVKDNSVAFKTSFKKELLRVIIHGMLHLLDFNDKSEAQQKKMRKMEDYYLNLYLRST